MTEEGLVGLLSTQFNNKILKGYLYISLEYSQLINSTRVHPLDIDAKLMLLKCEILLSYCSN